MSTPTIEPAPPAHQLVVDQAAYDAANSAFERELPELMKRQSYKRRWVLYHRDKRIGIAATKTELRRLARQLNLPLTEIVVRFITDVKWPTDLDELPDV